MTHPDPLSVLVVDEEPAILGFVARLFEGHDMRALLARSAQEALEIARRGYVPIDLILTDIVIRESADSAVSEISGAELLNRLRQIRPGTRSLYMSAYIDAGVIRIQPMNRPSGSDAGSSVESNLIESIRAAAVAPMTFHGGFSLRQ